MNFMAENIYWILAIILFVIAIVVIGKPTELSADQFAQQRKRVLKILAKALCENEEQFERVGTVSYHTCSLSLQQLFDKQKEKIVTELESYKSFLILFEEFCVTELLEVDRSNLEHIHSKLKEYHRTLDSTIDRQCSISLKIMELEAEIKSLSKNS